MTNYISSINGLSLLQDCGKNDSLFLVIHEDDLKNLSLEGLEQLLHLKTVMAQFELRKYTVLEERHLAIAAPIFQDEKASFVLVDEDFPEFHYFGDRVSKLGKGEAVKKTAKKSKIGKSSGDKISGEPVKTPVIKDTQKKIFPDKFELDAKDREITATFDNTPQGDNAPKPTAKTPEEVAAHERVQLAENMKKLLKLNPKKYGCNMGDDVFNLMIARVFKKANNDEETENGKKHVICRSIWKEIGYWRKANHIHKWFVDCVQDGEDDCEKYEVTKSNLLDLKAVCEEVLSLKGKDEGKIEEILPTESGFFFGSTSYDEYYFSDVEETIRIINNVLETTDFEKELVVYQSSW